MMSKRGCTGANITHSHVRAANQRVCDLSVEGRDPDKLDSTALISQCMSVPTRDATDLATEESNVVAMMIPK